MHISHFIKVLVIFNILLDFYIYCSFFSKKFIYVYIYLYKVKYLSIGKIIPNVYIFSKPITNDVKHPHLYLRGVQSMVKIFRKLTFDLITISIS